MTDRATQRIRDVKLGENVRIYDFVNLYECEVGDNSRVGTFVEIQKGARVGRNVKISSHTFICEGVTIEDDVFVGHNVSFINDRYPRATVEGRPQGDSDWQCVPTLVRRGASIGTSATIMCGVTIGEEAVVGAGSVVTRDVPARAVVAGVPARVLRSLDDGAAPEVEGTTDRGASAARVVSTRVSRTEGTSDVPFVDIRAQYQEIREEVEENVRAVLESGVYALGPRVAAFEEEFAAHCDTRYGVGVNSGASALHLALLAAGVGRGDEVVTVPFTFVATVSAIAYTGARPVLVDVDPVTLTMDPARLAAAITPRTKAILPVHLYGQPAEMEPLLDIARKHDLVVIEDAAQAHGAEYRDRRAGSLGHIGCFSFYPAKNLGACGEGGIAVTSDAELARRMRMLRDWGQAEKYTHVLPGFNYRMDALQGAILSVKLRHLERWTEARRAHAARYDRLLAGASVTTLRPAPDRRHVYHLYVVRTTARDALQRALRARGIHTGIHYPIPVHLQPAYADLGYRAGDFPVSEHAAREVLSLPMYPELTASQIDAVTAAVRESEERA